MNERLTPEVFTPDESQQEDISQALALLSARAAEVEQTLQSIRDSIRLTEGGLQQQHESIASEIADLESYDAVLGDAQHDLTLVQHPPKELTERDEVTAHIHALRQHLWVTVKELYALRKQNHDAKIHEKIAQLEKTVAVLSADIEALEKPLDIRNAQPLGPVPTVLAPDAPVSATYDGHEVRIQDGAYTAMPGLSDYASFQGLGWGPIADLHAAVFPDKKVIAHIPRSDRRPSIGNPLREPKPHELPTMPETALRSAFGEVEKRKDIQLLGDIFEVVVKHIGRISPQRSVSEAGGVFQQITAAMRSESDVYTRGILQGKPFLEIYRCTWSVHELFTETLRAYDWLLSRVERTIASRRSRRRRAYELRKHVLHMRIRASRKEKRTLLRTVRDEYAHLELLEKETRLGTPEYAAWYRSEKDRLAASMLKRVYKSK